MFLLSLKKFEKGFRSKSFKNKFNQKNSNELKSKQNRMYHSHHDVSFIIEITSFVYKIDSSYSVLFRIEYNHGNYRISI